MIYPLAQPKLLPKLDTMKWFTLEQTSTSSRAVQGWGRQLCARLLVFSMACALAPSAVWAQPVDAMGTLVYSPEQRRAMELARSGRSSPGDAVPGTDAGSAQQAAAASPTIRLDGIVTRERGKGTAWVNSEPVAQGTHSSTRIVGTEAVVDGHRLRVGQTFDKDTGTKTDVVPPGAVHKRLPP